MSELRPAGLAGLLHALQPRLPVAEPGPEATAQAAAEPEPDPALLRAAEDRALEAAAHARGLAEGRAEAEAALAPVVAALSAAARAFDEACRIDVDLLRGPLAQLVRTLCEQVLATELQASPAILLPLVEAALSRLRPAEPAVLRASPELLALLNDHCADALAQVQLAPDPAMTDAVELNGPEFIIHASLAHRLDDLLEPRS